MKEYSYFLTRRSNGDGFEAVSYTHLDVYKRQCWMAGGSSGLGCATVFLAKDSRMTEAGSCPEPPLRPWRRIAEWQEESMKLMHLSDLHIGKRVNEFSMLEDQKYILRQILSIADTQGPDGDVYKRQKVFPTR